jgi:hypothetical protein
MRQIRWWWLSPTLVSNRAGDGLNLADETLGHQQAQRVVDRLPRNGADLGPDDPGDDLGARVRPGLHGAEDGDALGSDLNAVLPKELRRPSRHPCSIAQAWTHSNNGL